MTVLPIVEREIRVASRRPRHHWTRLTAAVVACGATMWLLMRGNYRLTPELMGVALFHALAQIGFFACLLPGLLLTADCISEEKREGTLGLLFLTDLKGRDIVLGKLAATSANALFALMAGMPVLAIPVVMGGVTFGEVMRLSLILVNTLFFSLAAGMLVSAFSRRQRSAMVATGIVVFVAAFGFDMMGVPFHLLSLQQGLRILNDTTYTADPAGFYGSCGWVHAAAWALLGWACWVVPRRVEEKFEPIIAKDEATSLVPRPEEITGQQAEATGMAKLGEGNPVEWLAGRDGRPSGWMWITVIVSGLVWMTTHPFLSPQRTSPELAVVLGLLFHAFLKFWVALDAASRFSSDRAGGGLEMLLSTPLTVREILEGQLRAMARRFFPPMMCVLALDMALFLTGFQGGNTRAAGTGLLLAIQFVVVFTFLLDLVAVALFGMWQGLRSRRVGMAALRTAGRVMGAPTAGFSVVALLALASGGGVGNPSAWVAFWLILSVVNAAVCITEALRHLRRDFREMATLHAAGSPLMSAAAPAQ